MTIQLVGLKQLQKRFRFVGKDAFPRAAARAINRTATTVRAESAREIAKRMGTKVGDVKRRAKIRKARPGRLEASITFEGKALNLAAFKARQLKRGVSAAPWGRRRVFPGAFITRIGGKRLVMVRKKIAGGGRGTGETAASRQAAAVAMKIGANKPGRLPIRPMLGPGIAKTAADPEIARARERTINRVLPERLRRQIDRAMSRVR